MSAEALEPLDASAAISIREGVSSKHSATCSLWWCSAEEAEKFESGSQSTIQVHRFELNQHPTEQKKSCISCKLVGQLTTLCISWKGWQDEEDRLTYCTS